MRSIAYVITDRVGIHARPAGIVVKTAQKYQSEIFIYKDGKQADAIHRGLDLDIHTVCEWRGPCARAAAR